MADERILRRLPQLQKLHLTVPAPLPELLLKTERLKQVVRITGALSINIAPQVGEGQSYLEDLVDAAVQILTAVNASRTPPVTLTLVYYPYYWYDAPGTCPKPNMFRTSDHRECDDCPRVIPVPAGCPDDPRQICYDGAAVGEYAARVGRVKARLNAPGGPGVQIIGQQFFDTERWNITGRTEWDAAVTLKHNLFYGLGKQLLDRPIYQYERGAVAYVDLPTTHRYNLVPGNYYALDEAGDSFGVSLYTVPDLDRMRAMLQATIANAFDHAPPGVGDLFVVPWVALASGFREFGEAFDENWDYGVRAVRDFALWLKHFAQYPPTLPQMTIAPIGLYPGPFGRNTPHWMRYFIEYVRAFTQ